MGVNYCEQLDGVDHLKDLQDSLSSLASCRKLNIFYSVGALARVFSSGSCCIEPGNSDLRQFKRLNLKKTYW